jgi:hypothetical protein
MTPQLTLRNSAAMFRPGDEIVGDVNLMNPGPWTALHVDVILFWRTQGRGNRDEGVAAVANLARFEQKMPSGFNQEFSLQLPAHPWSYPGKMLKIRWYVGLYVAGEPKIDAEIELPIVVHPKPERFEGWNVEG